MFGIKMSQIDTENDNNPKIFQYSKFLCIFPKFLTGFVDWNVKQKQSGIDNKKDKNSKIFTNFVQFLSKY